jgi:hypothetical protein
MDFLYWTLFLVAFEVLNRIPDMPDVKNPLVYNTMIQWLCLAVGSMSRFTWHFQMMFQCCATCCHGLTYCWQLLCIRDGHCQRCPIHKVNWCHRCCSMLFIKQVVPLLITCWTKVSVLLAEIDVTFGLDVFGMITSDKIGLSGLEAWIFSIVWWWKYVTLQHKTRLKSHYWLLSN